MTLNMQLGPSTLGLGYLSNVVLAPGNNSVPIRATLSIPTLLADLPAIIGSTSQQAALKTGNLAIGATGNATVMNGQHIGYYESVLNKLQLEGQMPIVQLLEDSVETFLGSNSTLLKEILSAVKSVDPSILGDLLGQAL